MHRLRLLGAAFVAVLSLAAMLSASAFAANPSVLPAGTVANPVSGASKSGKSTFGSGFTTITSSSSTDVEEFTSEKGGKFSVKFAGSKDILGRECTGLEDTTKGTITVKGTIDLRYAKKGATLVVVALFLLNLKELEKEGEAGVHFSCGSTLAVVKGCVAGVVSEPYNKKVATQNVTLTKSGNDNEIIKVFNEAGTKEENCELLASQSEGKFELSAEETTQELSGFKQGGKAIEVEVMA